MIEFNCCVESGPVRLWKCWKFLCRWSSLISAIHFWSLPSLLATVRFCYLKIFFDWTPRNCFGIWQNVSRFIFIIFFLLLHRNVQKSSNPLFGPFEFFEMLIVHVVPRPGLPLSWPRYRNRFTHPIECILEHSAREWTTITSCF